ncbi:Hypermethylated in cancer 2 protein, partial [Nibea albiflora]
LQVAPCVQKAGSHAASLLAHLNLQRQQAQFCDCVVKHRQDPGQLYSAHRCVLAASSPVLASILSSTGALVELQAPCLSGTVLALVLDYVYTGALPRSQQQYYRLLSAACYLQMDELQESLRTECSSSSLQPCYEAVPVIRHSSTAALAEVSTVPSYHPVSQASITSSRASDSPSGSTDNDRITEGITTKHKNHYVPQNEDYRNNKDHTETQSLDYKDSSVHTYQCAMQDFYHKSSNSSNTEHDEHMDNGLSHKADDNDHHAHCDSFQSKNYTKHLMEESVPPYKDASSFTRGLKNKADFIFDDLPPKHERLDCSDCTSVSIATVAGQRAVVPLPLQETGSDSHYEDLCLEREAKEEHSYSSRCQQDSHCDLYGPKIDSYTILHGAEMTAKAAVASQHERDDRDKAMNNSTGRTSLEHENISGTEFSEQHLTFPVPMDMSDPSYNVVGQSYRGHLNYHCLPQEDTHLSHGNYDHTDYSHLDYSDQSNGEEVVGTFPSSGLSPLRQHFAATDQVVLLDISTKPAELLVSYRQRTDEGEKWVAFSQKDRFGNRFGENDREQQHEATRVNKSKVNGSTKFGADEAEAKLWVGETNVEERRIVTEEQSRPRAEVIHKAGHVDNENQTATLTCCSSPSVPDSVQAHVSTTLSVSIPSTLSVSMPTNISAHLSTTVHHPFQCSLCDRSFSQRGSLNRHVRSHLGVRPFPCPRCPMTFSRQYRVSEHMRVHQRSVLGSDFQKKPASSV